MYLRYFFTLQEYAMDIGNAVMHFWIIHGLLIHLLINV